jgi:hypothetical protein
MAADGIVDDVVVLCRGSSAEESVIMDPLDVSRYPDVYLAGV